MVTGQGMLPKPYNAVIDISLGEKTLLLHQTLVICLKPSNLSIKWYLM